MARKERRINVTVEVKYLPFPSEEAREEAYRVHAKLYLKAKERMLKKGLAIKQTIKK